MIFLAKSLAFSGMNLTSSTQFCPMVSYENIVKGLNDEIYPFNNPENYDYYTHADKWA